MGSDVIYDLVIGFENFPPVTLPHFFNFVSFLFYVFPSHTIHLSPLLITSFNILICYGGTSFLVVTSHCFEHCLTVITILVHIGNVNFLMFSRREKTLNFAFWSCFLVEKHDHILKVARSFMSSLEFLHITVKLQSRVQPC